MREAVICEPLRTPVGRYGGVLRTIPAAALAATVIQALTERASLDPAAIDDVIFGQCYPNGEAPAIGRVAALDAGLPVTVPGLRWGVRGDSTDLFDRIARGRVTAGGRDYPVPGGMLETAENLRRDYGITRQAQDELACASHQRAVAAQEQGRFKDEIVPVAVPSRKGPITVVEVDEHPRADTNDGAAACIVTTPERAADLGLAPLARLVTWAVAGVAPARMGIGPVPATAKALDRVGLTLADIDLIELNEAFAAQVLAVTAEWSLRPADFDRLNVNGSGISLGHPVGATGVRILATMQVGGTPR